MPADCSPKEFVAYIKCLEELAWKEVGHCDAYETLMEDPPDSQLAYVVALEKLILLASHPVDRPNA